MSRVQGAGGIKYIYINGLQGFGGNMYFLTSILDKNFAESAWRS